MEKGDAIRAVLIIGIFLVLISILFVLKGGLTGYAIFQNSDSEFNNGIYNNTEYNGSGIILSGNNLTGTYISEIFDAGNNAHWNNLSWQGVNTNLQFMYAVDGSGSVYESLNSGINWTEKNSNYGRTTNTEGMFYNNYLYIIVNKEVWNSTDSGISWSIINNSFSNKNLLEGEADSNRNLYAVQTDGVIYKSIDNGISWNEIGDFNGATTSSIKGIAIDSNNIIFVADGSNSVYSSSDQGQTWTEKTSSYGGGTPADLTLYNNSLYILNNKEVWNSTDSGISWSLVNDSFTSYSNNGLRIDSDFDGNLYIIDTIGRVWKSNDSGLFWNEIGDFNGAATNNVKGMTTFTKFTNISFQVRSCNDEICNGEIWQNLNSNPQNLSINNNRYFQYKVIFSTPGSNSTPILNSVDINYDLLNTAPLISIASPQQGATYGYNESLNLNFSALDSDNNLDSCWYNINNGENITLINCVNATFNVSANGEYTINIFVNDSLSEQSNDSSTFNIQLGAPSIILNYPLNNTYFNNQEITFNYTPSDIDLDSCELFGNFNGEFKLNQTDNFPITDQINNFSLNLTDNAYLWNIRCNDSAGNSATNGNKTFYVDTISPVLTITEPVNRKTNRTNMPLIFSVNDSSPIQCYYNLTTSIGTIVISNTEILDCLSLNFDVANDGDYIIYLGINDSAGNFNFTSSNFSVDSSISIPSASSGGGNSGGGGRGIGAVIINKTKKLKVSDINDIIARQGDRKTLSLDVKNNGKNFLNNCKLTTTGKISSWIISKQIQGIAPGESVDFLFEINIPEDADIGDYIGELGIDCEEESNKQSIKISIPGLQSIKLKEIKNEKNGLNISYVFNNSDIIGEKISVKVWIVDKDNVKIKEFIDSFTINREGLIERNVLIKLPDGLSGIYSVYFALSNDLDNFIKKSVVLGKSVGTGFAVLNTKKSKRIFYGFFVLILLVGIFFILKNHKKQTEKLHKSKNKWLLRKKRKFWFK